MSTLKPAQKAPALSLKLVGGGTFTLNDLAPEALSLVVFYRGLHCPICKNYLNALQDALPELRSKGVEVVAVTTEDEGRAAQAKQDWGLDRIPIAFGLGIDAARGWGLHVTNAMNPEQPAQYAEPGLFLVRPDGSVYYSAVNSAPFGRPPIADIVKMVNWVTGRGFPGYGQG